MTKQVTKIYSSELWSMGRQLWGSATRDQRQLFGESLLRLIVLPSALLLRPEVPGEDLGTPKPMDSLSERDLSERDLSHKIRRFCGGWTVYPGGTHFLCVGNLPCKLRSPVFLSPDPLLSFRVNDSRSYGPGPVREGYTLE